MGKRGPKANPASHRKQRGIRFSDREWSEVRYRADQANKPVSTYVRDAALKAEEKHNDD
jgi:hypothetical protein